MAERIKISELLLDYDLYPRDRIEPYNVSQMVETLRAWLASDLPKLDLPPILVDRKSKRVIDGFHRVRAYQKVHGDNATIPVEFKDYKNDAEMFSDAIRLNASHGRQLSTYDRARCIAKAEGFNLELGVVSSLLNMTLERIAEMKTDRFATYNMQPWALKRTSAHLAGKDLTEEEASYNVRAGGMHQTFYINQVIAMLEAETVDWESQKVVNALKKLYDLLEKVTAVRV